MVIPIDVEADLQEILDEIADSNGAVTKRVVTKTLNTYGRNKGASDSDSSVNGVILPISSLDSELFSAGWIDTKNHAGFFKLSDSLAVHNKIVDGSDVYIILSLKEHGFPGVSNNGLAVVELSREP